MLHVQVPLWRMTVSKVLIVLLRSRTLIPMRLVVRLLSGLQLSDVHFPAWDPNRLKKLKMTLVSGSAQCSLMWLRSRQLTFSSAFCWDRYNLTTVLMKLDGDRTAV